MWLYLQKYNEVDYYGTSHKNIYKGCFLNLFSMSLPYQKYLELLLKRATNIRLKSSWLKPTNHGKVRLSQVVSYWKVFTHDFFKYLHSSKKLDVTPKIPQMSNINNLLTTNDIDGLITSLHLSPFDLVIGSTLVNDRLSCTGATILITFYDISKMKIS